MFDSLCCGHSYAADFYAARWYDEVIRRIGKVDESIPIYISDAWNLETCLQWTIERNMFTYTRTFRRNDIQYRMLTSVG